MFRFLAKTILKAFVTLLLVFLFVTMATFAFSQNVDRPASPISKVDFRTYIRQPGVVADIAGDFYVRGMDAKTTHDFLTDPCKCMHEAVLPKGLVGSPIGMYAYSFAVAGASQYIGYELYRHGHQKLSWIARKVDIAVDGPAFIHNEQLIASHHR